ncbi:MAG TPA: histidine kinase dimerization/phosphoacceptor domain -containing protein, partial [Bacteroidia bacterium]|nr:histidine kinase dimerization/phosphoacceptor domain -containing protein [Bacteroidia bacterium]
DFTIRYVNRTPSYLTAGIMVGVPVIKFVSPEHTEAYLRFLNAIKTTGIPGEIELETSLIISEHQTSKNWYSCKGSTVKDSEGKTESILVISKNITRETRHAMEIKDKEEKLYAILNNTTDVILSIDRAYHLTEYNSVFSVMMEKGFGVANGKGTSVLDYVDPKKHTQLKALYERVFEGEVANVVESFDTKTGLTVYNETSYHPIRNFRQEITGISIFSKDITQRVLDEQKLKNTLREKEVLLAEIHHRIKNNLALVSSLLQLKELNIDNADAKEALSDSRKRIKSTALVHEMLYRNETFDHILLNDYLSELFSNLNTGKHFTLDIRGDNPELNLSKALPFGLMMHELMMNSFKHSFKNKVSGCLEVVAGIDKGVLFLEYCDCEGEFPEQVDFNDTTSTGLMLIHTFIEQLDGNINLDSRKPPRYSIQIPLA